MRCIGRRSGFHAWLNRSPSVRFRNGERPGERSIESSFGRASTAHVRAMSALPVFFRRYQFYKTIHRSRFRQRRPPRSRSCGNHLPALSGVFGPDFLPSFCSGPARPGSCFRLTFPTPICRDEGNPPLLFTGRFAWAMAASSSYLQRKARSARYDRSSGCRLGTHEASLQ